jgi:hypothetical protein
VATHAAAYWVARGLLEPTGGWCVRAEARGRMYHLQHADFSTQTYCVQARTTHLRMAGWCTSMVVASLTKQKEGPGPCIAPA